MDTTTEQEKVTIPSAGTGKLEERTQEAERTQEEEAVYSTANAIDILSDTRPAPPEVWGGLTLAPGQIMEVIGASGLGKSRMMLNLAINQILGRPFAGLPTYKEPLTWLFYGNENSYFRFREDLQKMLQYTNAEQKEKLRKHLFLPTMEKSEDVFISFSDESNVKRFKATICQRKPDVVVMDPWGAIIAGDELSDKDVRNTIVAIQDVLRANPDKPAVGIILNHSRNGLREEIDAAGPNRANFGKNSKAIYSVVRAVWNLRRAELSDTPTKIELLNAKASDRKPYPPRAVEFDPKTALYNEDTTFRHDVWQATLETLAKERKSTLSPEAQQAAKQEVDEERRKQIIAYVTTRGPFKKNDLKKWATNQGWRDDQTQELISDLVANETLAEITQKNPSWKFIGTKDQITKLKQDSPVDTFQ